MGTERLRLWHRLVWLAVGLHCLVTLALALTRLHTDKAAMVDMGFYDQALWTAATSGTPTISMYPPYDVRHFFTLHFVPLVLVLAPIYPYLPIEGLIVAQSLLIGMSALIVFRALLKMKIAPKDAFVWALVYLLNPFLVNGAAWDFRERALALPLIAAALYALIARQRGLFVTALALLALCQEHFGLAIFGFGLLWISENGRDRTGLLTAGGGLLTVAAVALIMSGLKPAGDATALVGGELHVARYEWLMQPSVWIPALKELIPQAVEYGFFYLSVPFLGLSLLSPVFLLPGLADLAANLLSLNPMPRSIFAYHSMTLIPMCLIAAVRTSLRLSNPGRWARFSLLSTLALTYATFPGPLPGAANPWKVGSLVLQRDRALDEIGRMVSPSMSVSVQSGIGSFFSRRRLAYLFPVRMNEVDAVILHLEYPYSDLSYAPFSIPYASYRELQVDEMRADVLPAIRRLVEDRSYGIVYWHRNWLLALRGAEDKVDRRAVQEAVAKFQHAFTHPAD